MLSQDGKGLVEHRGVVDADKAAVGARLKVDAHALAKAEVLPAEEVAHGLDRHVQFVGNAVHAALGQGVLDGTELVEGHYFTHGRMGIMFERLFLMEL